MFYYMNNVYIIQKKETLRLLSGCGSPTRTNDLQVMSLASYQLLHPAIFLFCECKGTSISWNGQMFNLKNLLYQIKQRRKRHKVLNLCKKLAVFLHNITELC